MSRDLLWDLPAWAQDELRIDSLGKQQELTSTGSAVPRGCPLQHFLARFRIRKEITHGCRCLPQIKQPSIVSYRSPFSCHDKLQFLSCLSGGPSSLSSSATLTQCRCPRAPLVLWQFQTGKASSREVLFKLLLGARKKWPDRLFVVLLLMHAMRPLQTDKGETRHPATPLKHARDVGSTHKPSIANSGRRTGVVCVVPVSDGRQFATLCRPGSVVAAAKSKPVALALARQAKVRSWEVITWRHQV